MRHLLFAVAIIFLIEVFVSAHPTAQGIDIWKSENGQHKISVGGLPTPSPSQREHMHLQEKMRRDKNFGGMIGYTWNF